MKAVVQRVRNASVEVGGRVSGSIGWGLLVYLGVARDDSAEDAGWMAGKVSNLRIFDDCDGKMNLSLLDILAQGQSKQEPKLRSIGVLAISQFTLLADARKGRRPFYGEAAEPELANKLYEHFMAEIRGLGLVCEAGVFQTHMNVSYTNDGPVTIILESS